MKKNSTHLYYVAYAITGGEFAHTLVEAQNAAAAAATAKNLRGGDYDRTVEVFRMVREPVEH